MTGKTHIHPDEKIGLKLTGAERKLILEGLIHIDDELAVPIRNTPADVPVMLTLDDLDDLAGCVAAEAHHSAARPSHGGPRRLAAAATHPTKDRETPTI